MNETDHSSRLSVTEAQRELVSAFRDMGDLFSQYTYLVKLSSHLPIMSEEDRQVATLVEGCQSQVWLLIHSDLDGTMRLQAESDTLIVRGILYLICSLLDGRAIDEVRRARITFVEETDLHEAFSDERLSGFASICTTIREYAAKAQGSDTA